VTELARHFYAAADLGDREDAFTYARRAGELARERFAFADAAVHFEQAARLAEQLPGLTDRELCELAIDWGEALHRAGDPGHQAVLLDAAATARRLDDADLLTRAALALSEQGWTIAGVGSPEVVEVARDALERLPAGAAASRARLMAVIAAAIHLTGGHEQRGEAGTRAMAVARASGDGNVLAEVLISAHWALFDPLNLDQRLDWAQEACELGERLHNPVVLGQTLRMLGQDLLESGDLAGARAAFGRADRIADELDAPALRIFAAASGATLAALAGRLDDAERLAADCTALARRIGGNGPFFVGAGLAVSIERGLWEDGVGTVKALSERMGWIAAFRTILAMFHARLGHVDEARLHLRHFTEARFATLPRVIHWGPGMVMLADAATWLRDAEAATSIRELLEPVTGRTPWNAFTALWPIDIALAQLSVVLGDHARAHTYLDAAEETCRRNDVPAHRVRVELYRAWALREAGEAVDARPALAAADASPCAGLAREARLMGLAE
jgi:tetratricopeptide (TPR) repeat protein